MDTTVSLVTVFVHAAQQVIDVKKST